MTMEAAFTILNQMHNGHYTPREAWDLLQDPGIPLFPLHSVPQDWWWVYVTLMYRAMEKGPRDLSMMLAGASSEKETLAREYLSHV